MHSVLRGEAEAADVALRLGVNADRLTIYRDFVAEHIDGALTKIYPMVRALLGTQRSKALGADFFQRHPPSHWELNRCVEPFARYLDARASEHGDVDPFLVALARYEWEEFEVYMHPANVVTSAFDQLAVNPTLSILSFPYALAPFVVAAAQLGPTDPPLSLDTVLPPRLSRDVLTLIFRKPVTHAVAYYHGSDDLLFAIKVVHAGLRLQDAAEQAGATLVDATAALDHAKAIGLLV